MKKILVAIDSFKGSMSSLEACEAISEAAKEAGGELEVISIPVADGGEGTIEALGAEKQYCTVNDAFFKPVEGYWGEIDETAVIELAVAAGLPMAKHPDPSVASTIGVGELILNALDRGKRKFILALGGSSTNDMGCGMACALGAKFYDAFGKEFIPAGGTLSAIEKIDLSSMDKRLDECEFTTMCDVTNPLFGANGAACVFAPQKGATSEMLPILDQGLRHAGKKLEEALGISISNIPGAGAAGGCGAGSVAFLNSVLKSGIDTVLELKNFSELCENADLVITGEGRFDSQSIDGKVVSGVAKRCLAASVPLIVLCGSYSLSRGELPKGILSVFSIVNSPCTIEQALIDGKKNLRSTAFHLFRTFFA